MLNQISLESNLKLYMYYPRVRVRIPNPFYRTCLLWFPTDFPQFLTASSLLWFLTFYTSYFPSEFCCLIWNMHSTWVASLFHHFEFLWLRRVRIATQFNGCWKYIYKREERQLEISILRHAKLYKLRWVLPHIHGEERDVYLYISLYPTASVKWDGCSIPTSASLCCFSPGALSMEKKAFWNSQSKAASPLLLV